MFFSKDFTVYTPKPVEPYKGRYRVAGGTTDVDGNYIEPKAYIKSIKDLNIQPDYMDNIAIEKVAKLEGTDNSGAIKIYSDDLLQYFSQDTSKRGLLIAYENNIYEVFGSGFWNSHYKSRAVLKKETIAMIEDNSEEII